MHNNVQIHQLVEFPQYADTVSEWIYEQWWRPIEGHSLETIKARLDECCQINRIPLTLIALYKSNLVGTASLIINDLEQRKDLSPWLAALYVLPEFRNKGIGSRLVRTVVETAKQIGVTVLYLYTDLPSFYTPLGWSVMEKIENNKGSMSIMDIETSM